MFTVPVTGAPPVVVTRVKLAVVIVELVIGSEKVAETEELVATPVAPFAGEVADTVGGAKSGAAAGAAERKSPGCRRRRPPAPRQAQVRAVKPSRAK